VIGLYKTECVRHDGPFRGVDDLERATLSCVHWLNSSRLHTALDYATPIEHEAAYYRQIDTQQEPLPGQLTLHQCRGGSGCFELLSREQDSSVDVDPALAAAA
jgi:putative transposase